MEGPVVIGNPTTFPIPFGTLNVAPLTNDDNLIPPVIPGAACFPISNPYSLAVSGPAAILGNLDTSQTLNAGLHVFAQGHVFSNCGGHVLAAKKDFDIKHPSKEGWRLRYVAPEAPTADVYYRGKVVNKTGIVLPLYWKDLVDWTTITVNLTPIGAHQNVIVKRKLTKRKYISRHMEVCPLTASSISMEKDRTAREISQSMKVNHPPIIQVITQNIYSQGVKNGRSVQRDIPPQKDCNEYPTWGQASPSYHYIFKGNKKEDEYPEEACPPWYHSTAQIDKLKSKYFYYW